MAKKLATRLQGKTAIIYGCPTLTDAVALRWKCQLCENAKVMSFSNLFAEFNHNELVGWAESMGAVREHLVVIVLRDMDDHPQIKIRMDFVKSVVEELEVEVIEIYSRGDTPLERMFSLIQLGDFVSYYLAILNNVDPTPVEVIQRLKRTLTDNTVKSPARSQS
jgi:glucose/mannose-6-phosphate isomerase